VTVYSVTDVLQTVYGQHAHFWKQPSPLPRKSDLLVIT